MAKVTIETIKKLREHTGAGVMEAKKALEESGGDEKKAVKLINKHGLVKAEKRAEREVPEGVIASYVHHGGKIATLLELKCEKQKDAEQFQRIIFRVSWRCKWHPWIPRMLMRFFPRSTFAIRQKPLRN